MRPETTETANVPEVARPREVRLPHRQHWSWWIVAAFLLLCLVALIHVLVTNPNLQWNVVWEYLFHPSILAGLVMTIKLTVFAMLLGVTIGVLTAVLRLSPIKILSVSAYLYQAFFRGTPVLVQIIFWFNLAALFNTIQIGVPIFGPTFYSVNTNAAITPFVAALLGLALNEGAYMSEIVRGGLLSVDSGQEEAAKALGMSSGRALRRIVLPQAMRVIVPPTGNQVIGMLKTSALVSVTAVTELLYSAQLIYQQTFQTIPLLIVASIWYLVLTSVLSVAQYYLERRFAQGARRALPPTPLQRAVRMWRTTHVRLTGGIHR
jgi:polar amino acid transport system permease protein